MLSICLQTLVLAHTSQAALHLPLRVDRLEVLVREIGKVSGNKMEVSPLLANDVFGMSADGESLKSIMDALAKATHAGWVRREDALVLEQTAEMIDAQRAQSLNTRTKDIQEWIDRQLKTEQATPFDKAAAEDYVTKIRAIRPTDGKSNQVFQNLLKQSPDMALLRSMVRAVGAARLAIIPEGKRVVFSPTPNRSQVAISGDYRAWVKSLMDQKNLLWKASISHPLPDDGMRFYGEQFDEVKDVAKLDLAVSNQAGSFQVTFLAFDSLGQNVGRASEFFSPFNTNELLAALTKETGDKVTFSKDAETLRNLFRRVPGVDAKSLMKYFQGALENEPLSLGNTDFLAAWATVEKKPLLIALPDVSLGMVTFGGMNPTVDSYKVMLKTLDSPSEDAHWVIWTSKDATLDQTRRSNRRSLAESAKILEKRTLSLDERAALALKFPQIQDSYLFLVMNTAIRGNQRTFNDLQDPWLRLYGTLTGPHKQALRENRPLMRNDLNSNELKALTTLVFDSSNMFLQYDYSRANAQTDFRAVDRFQSGIYSEPTEMCPDGALPARFVLSCDYESKQDWFANLGSWQGMSSLDAGRLAAEDFSALHNPGTPARVPYDQAKYYKGSHQSYGLKLFPVENFFYTGQLTDDSIDTTKEFKMADVGDEFWKQLAEFKKAYQNSDSSGSRQKVQP